MTRRLIAEFARTPAAPKTDAAALAALTEREREVVALVARGLSNAEIAKELYISPATAKTHVSRAMLKLGARDRAQLVVMAFESGLAAPGGGGSVSAARLLPRGVPRGSLRTGRHWRSPGSHGHPSARITRCKERDMGQRRRDEPTPRGEGDSGKALRQ